MRLVSYEIGSKTGYGAVLDGGVFDFARRLGARYPTLLDLIRADALSEARALLRGAGPDYPLAEVRLLPPLLAPEKILCVGVNYQDRNEEYRDNAAAAQYPSLFYRAPTSFVGHGQPVERPRVSQQFDYEGEIVLVIGKGGRHIAKADALDHVLGVTLCNEGSVRDWMRHGKFNVTQGKNFDRSGSLGPWIVTTDEIDLRKPLHLTTRINGEIRQDDTTARMIFGFADLIAYITAFATLRPGDIIVTGTPTGAGARFNPPKWLVPGDVVEVAVPEIGVLRNAVVDEAV